MKEYVEKALKYDEYLSVIDGLLAVGKTTGDDQSEEKVYFGKLNRQRMKRLDKTVKIGDELSAKLKSIKHPLVWLTLTEGWCGDAAQNVPAIEKMAAENPLITTRYLLRDENLELMDQHLTNGGRAIPIMLCIDGETLELLGKWGSRPALIQNYFLELKAQGMEKPEIMEEVQRKYNADKERAIQAEFTELIDACLLKSRAAKS